jgi:glycosyltransferase involved in cell wall biosynthesis
LGGAERYAQGLAEGLAGRGHEVHVVAPDVDDPEAFYELGHTAVGVAREPMNGVEVHRLPYVSTGYRRLGALIGQKRVLENATRSFQEHLRARIFDLKPDVIVTLPHLFPNVVDVLRLRPSATWKLLYVPMLHEDDPYWSTERVSEAVGRADGVIALTHHERARLIESYGAPTDTTVVIPPGVEPGVVVPYENRDPVVLFLGRRTASKRLDVLYEAMKIVWHEMPEVVLQVAGSPPGAGRDPTVWIAADPRVRIIDSPSEKEKDQLLGRARLLVSPSLTESFGITTLEAWAQATPVVVADSPVNRSIVRADVDAIVVDVSSPERLAPALIRLLKDSEFAESLGEAGRRRAQADFSWLQSVAALEVLARRL